MAIWRSGHGTGSTEEVNARESIQDFGFQGDGFWFQGAGVSVVGNISAGNQGNAFVYYTRGLIEGGVQTAVPSANLADPSIAQGADKDRRSAWCPCGSSPTTSDMRPITGLTVRYHLENATHGTEEHL